MRSGVLYVTFRSRYPYPQTFVVVQDFYTSYRLLRIRHCHTMVISLSLVLNQRSVVLIMCILFLPIEVFSFRQY